MDDLFLQEEIVFLRTELDSTQQIAEILLKQISENFRPMNQVENTTFNNFIKNDVNIKSSKCQSPSKLINDNTMEKYALTKEK